MLEISSFFTGQYHIFVYMYEENVYEESLESWDT